MIKRFYIFLVALLSITAMQAQSIRVQGVSRSVKKAKTSLRATPNNDILPGIVTDSVVCKVGSGRKVSYLVVKWDDGKGSNKNLVWKYLWTTEAEGTGEAMLKAIAKADPRFYMLVYGGTQYGTAIGGMGFDLNGNGNISLLKNGVSYSLTDGLYNTSTYDFDHWTSNDSLDHWRAGWYNGYWSYWTTDALSTPYAYSSVGASSRHLSNGSVDGWVYMSDMVNWYSNDMSGELEYVTPIANASGVAPKTNQARSQTNKAPGKTTIVKTYDEFKNAIEKAADGDVIEFDPALAGKEITPTDPIDVKNKNITINGNGVTFVNYNEAIWFTSDIDNTSIETKVKNLNFKNYSTPIQIDQAQVTLENCTFDNCKATSNAVIQATNYIGYKMKLNLIGCRFSNNTSTATKRLPIIEFYGHGGGKVEDAKGLISSCSFVGNDAYNAVIGISNPGSFEIVNSVFQDNKIKAKRGNTILKRDNMKGFKLLGHNIIEGGISEHNNAKDTIATNKYLSSTDIVGEDLKPLTYNDDLKEYVVISTGKAFNNLPANTTYEGVLFPKKDLLGNVIDYTKPTHSGACQTVVEAPVDYTNGVFIVNEDWFGHQNSTLNFISNDGEWTYRVIQKENPGKELGATAQYGTIYGDKFYIISKQEKDPGASIVGGRLTIADAKTLKIEKQLTTFATNSEGKSIADGRSFLGVDETKAYIGTSNGIYILDLTTNEIKGQISGAEGSATDLYSGQIGNMVRVDNKVYAVHQTKGLIVIDAITDKVRKVIPAEEGWGFGSVVLSKDGNLWLSLADKNGSGKADTRIVKLNPKSYKKEVITLPKGTFGPANSWYAWTPDGFCASTQQNVLYWNGGESSWFSNKTIFKYDIDKKECTKFIAIDDPWKLYGCSMRVHPVTDELYVSLYQDFGNQSYTLRKYDTTGTIINEYPMIANYWFPSLPIFPDNFAPTAKDLDVIPVSKEKNTVIPLKDFVEDKDNMASAIIMSVKEVSYPEIFEAKIINGNLVIMPTVEPDGEQTVTIKINSNGKIIEKVVTIEFMTDEALGVNEIETENETKEKVIYDLQGRRVKNPQHGIYIVNGKKVVFK